MGDPLRQRHAPIELAEEGQVIEINDKISDYQRLSEIVGTDLAALDASRVPADWAAAPLTGRLAFGYVGVDRRAPALEGEVWVEIDAVCQRCLGPFRLPLSAELKLLLSTPGHPISPREGYETWELVEDRVQPAEIVEEALIMAMPLSAKHADRDACASVDGEPAPAGKTVRPFAALRAQMETNDR